MDRASKIWKCSKYSDLDAFEINNLAEYGQPASPYFPVGAFDHDFQPDFAKVVVEMPQLEVMTNGYGKNLTAESFGVVSRFLNDDLPFPTGTYTFDDLVTQGFATRSDRRIAGNLYLGGTNGFVPGGLSADSAAYIHGTVAAALMKGTRFEYSAQKRRVDAEIGAIDDNWDFESSTIPSIIEVLVASMVGPDHYNLEAPIQITFRGEGRHSIAERITEPEDSKETKPGTASPPEEKDKKTSKDPGGKLSVTEGGISGSHSLLPVLPILVAPTISGKGKNTIRQDLIPVACWKLNNARFAFASSFVLPETRDDFTRLAELRKAHPGAPLSIFGHADPVGDDDFNKVLSGHRATAVYGVLIRDTDRWEKLYNAGAGSEGWGTGSVQRMLAALGRDPGPPTGAANAQTTAAIKSFQSDNGLTTDGVAGPKTRKKLFAAYMDFLCADKLSKTDFLARGADPGGKGDLQGCSEFNAVMRFSSEESKEFAKPSRKAERDVENEVNRRVMVLLFRPGTAISVSRWPCPRTEEGVSGCRKRFWSDAATRQAPQQERRQFEITQNTFACRFYQRLVTGSPCEVVDPPQVLVRIRLFDRCGKSLPFAPCLVKEEGKAPRGDRASGPADTPEEDAVILIRDPQIPSTVHLKWNRPSQGDSASSPPPGAADSFEFEMDVRVEIEGDTGETPSMHRLENLGYLVSTDKDDDIRAFQRHHKKRFPDIVVDGTLNAPTLNAIQSVHDKIDPTLKGTL